MPTSSARAAAFAAELLDQAIDDKIGPSPLHAATLDQLTRHYRSLNVEVTATMAGHIDAWVAANLDHTTVVGDGRTPRQVLPPEATIADLAAVEVRVGIADPSLKILTLGLITAAACRPSGPYQVDLPDQQRLLESMLDAATTARIDSLNLLLEVVYGSDRTLWTAICDQLGLPADTDPDDIIHEVDSDEAFGPAVDELDTRVLAALLDRPAHQVTPPAPPTAPAAPGLPALRRDRLFDTMRAAATRAHRDMALIDAVGRVPDASRPLQPGDLPAVRGTALMNAIGAIERAAVDEPPAMFHGGDPQAAEHAGDIDRLAAVLARTCEAVPYFVPTDEGAGLLGSRPPDRRTWDDLRLPYDSVLVVLSRTVPVEHDGATCDVRGIVLLADGDGRLGDAVVWLDEAAVGDGVANLLRAGVPTSVSERTLVGNLAAAVSWGSWTPPRDLDPPPVDTREWRKFVRTGRVRRGEPRGHLAGVHTIDLARTASPRRGSTPTGRTVRAHLRRGHWRRVRVGPADRFRYEARWIPPTVVGVSEHPVDRSATVYRLPERPATGAVARR